MFPTRKHDTETKGPTNAQSKDEYNGIFCCNPHHTCHRFIALILICSTGFATSFCYDAPGGLQDRFKEDLGMSTTKLSMLYSIYAWPSVFLSIVGGFLIDRFFGIRFGTILFLIIQVIGQIIFAIGGTVNQFWLMMVGRFIFGFGAEVLAVALNKYAVRWFIGKELSTAMGTQLCFNRIGSTINFLLMEPLYQEAKKYFEGSHVIGAIMFFSLIICLFSLLCAVILAWMDKRAKRILRKENPPVKEVIKFSDIKSFKYSFWLVCIIIATYYIGLVQFISLGKSFFEKKFEFTPEKANQINSVIYMISAFGSPICGYFIDKTGRNILWMFVSSLATISGHVLLAFTSLNPFIGVCLMGVTFSVWASCIWPLIALIIPEYQLGTAFGICQSNFNLAFAVAGMFTGLIADKAGYIMLEVFFIGCLCVSQLVALTLWINDYKNSGYLNMTPNQRKKFKRAIGIINALDTDSTNTNS